MAKRVSFSHQNLELDDISIYHLDSENSLRLYYKTKNEERFANYTDDDLANELRDRTDELNRSSCLSLLAAVEAVFRIDYLQRNYKKKKDALSRKFRAVYKMKSIKVSLEDDILDAWKEHSHGASQLISDLKGVYKYRHWLAHGRYWQPKMGRQNYDYGSVYELAELTLNSFPFEGADSIT